MYFPVLTIPGFEHTKEITWPTLRSEQGCRQVCPGFAPEHNDKSVYQKQREQNQKVEVKTSDHRSVRPLLYIYLK